MSITKEAATPWSKAIGKWHYNIVVVLTGPTLIVHCTTAVAGIFKRCSNHVILITNITMIT